MSKIKKNKTKQLRISADLFHILSQVKLDAETWSKTARRFLDNYVKAVYPEVVQEIDKQFQLADEILKNEPIAAEVIKGD